MATLACRVSGAAASDTSFALSYTPGGPGSRQQPMEAACAGPLHDGAGSCTQTYALVAQAGSAPGSVAGQALPSHTPLGPVRPSPTS